MKNDYEKRQEKMQKEAEKVGLGGLNKLADYAINIGESANILKRIKNIGAKYTKLRQQLDFRPVFVDTEYRSSFVE